MFNFLVKRSTDSLILNEIYQLYLSEICVSTSVESNAAYFLQGIIHSFCIFRKILVMKKKIYCFLLSLIILNLFIISGCKKDDTGEIKEDEELYQELSITTGFTYYKNNDTIMHSSSESAHTYFFRVRFNETANAVLTDDGKIPASETFPDGAIVVKELFDSQDGELQLIAVMKKSSSGNSAEGWLWAEYEPGGSVVYSTSEKGNGCTGCHSVNDRDLVRLFNLFP